VDLTINTKWLEMVPLWSCTNEISLGTQSKRRMLSKTALSKILMSLKKQNYQGITPCPIVKNTRSQKAQNSQNRFCALSQKIELATKSSKQLVRT
jgi:hypothetical protein